ncbi:MAG: ABC transporter ATP-binding protein [Liquorilactobacillus hordei]|uniref:ABC transporter transmembrane domain-containing protein n=1 Tax=Liquorilactobacillus hordei TaxID=468911 RepID=UPI0039EC6360
MDKIVHYFKQNKMRTIMLLIIMIVATTLDTLGSVFLTNLTDSIAHESKRLFVIWFMIIVLVSIGRVIFGNLTNYVQEILVEKLSIDLRGDIVQKIVQLSYGDFHNKWSVGDYTSWLTNDIQQIKKNGFFAFCDVCFYVLELVIPTFTLCFYNWSLAVTALLLSLVLLFLPKMVGNMLDSVAKEVTLSNSSFTTVVTSILGGFDTLIFFGKRSVMKSKINEESQNVYLAQKNYSYHNMWVNNIVGAISVLSQISIIGLTGLLAVNKNLSVGSVMSTGSLAAVIFMAMQNITSNIVVIKSTKPVFDKFVLLSANKNIENKQYHNNSQLKVPSLYVKDVALPNSTGRGYWLKPVSFKVVSGTKVLLAGPSGVGKSTLLRIIAGVTTDYEGTIDWNSDSNSYMPLYLPQKPYIFSDTIKFNLTLGAKYSQEVIEGALREVNLLDKIAALPQQMDTMITADGADFSGGERQRLALARALITQPRVLLLDESTSSLDEKLANKIMFKLMSIKDLTMIVVEHKINLEREQQFDQIIQLS